MKLFTHIRLVNLQFIL